MPQMTESLSRWGSQSFNTALKAELEGLPSGTLPLDKACSRGGYADDRGLTVTIRDVNRTERAIRARIGVFFSEVVAGCSCGDPPLVENAYCDMAVVIDRESAEAVFSVITD
jgi:hypothetical protein